MRTDIVFTLTGPDRVGIVEEVTKVMLDLDGNVEASRMARLGGEFAIIMLVSLPAQGFAELDTALVHLTSAGYKVTASRTEEPAAEKRRIGRSYRIEVEGADHEGIIHDIAHGLSQRGINIESMDTRTTPASTSGTPLFSMTALVVVPSELSGSDWQAELDEAGAQANVDVTATAVDGD